MSESASMAIIGLSCLFPKADDLQAYWRNIKSGVDAITPVPEGSHWDQADYYDPDPKAQDRTYARRGGFLSPVDFNPMEFGISPKDIEATDTTQLLGMMAAKQALQDAGYGDKPFDRSRASVILGVTGALELVIPLGARLGHPIWRRALREAGVEEPVAEDVVRRIADAYVGWQENSFPGLLGNVAAGRIANRLDLGGTNCVVDAACASSLAALHLACLELSSGRSDLVITGGVDTFNDVFMYMCFSKTPALSPSGDAKPFDRSCDGTIIGEGLGMVVLKRLADAQRDGDRIYAVIKGVGTSSDARGNAVYAPRAEGQKVALERAYRLAGVTPDTIDLIEAHGTGTKVGDAAELRALTEVYRQARPEGTWAAVGSVKSQIGHTKAAAGVAGLIKAALALHHKVLPPTIKVSQPVDELASGRSPLYVNTQKRPWLPRATHPRRAGVSSFGFGGTNFHCVLEEHAERRPTVGWDGDVEILAFSADRREDLRRQVTTATACSSWAELRRLAWRSRGDFRPEAKYRLLVPVQREGSAASWGQAVLGMLDQHPEDSRWSLPGGAAFGSEARRGRLGVLFPGQGSQYVGMLGDLACQFPGALEAIAEADRIFALEHPEAGDCRLSDYIYPQPAFSDEARRQQEEALKATEVAQPGIGAVSWAAWNVLAYFGVQPEAVAGHSYGELPALCGAGRFEPEWLHRLSNVRGRLMSRRNGHSDRGAMLAVQADEAVVTEFLRQEHPELVVANRNSPRQFVLAGPQAGIEAAAAGLAQRSIRARLLPVSAAFHSSWVADARGPFAAVLETAPFAGGGIPVYANATAGAYPKAAQPARELLAEQIVRPVDFLAQVQAMHADGVETFLEVGPGHVLTDLVHTILEGKGAEAIALDSGRGKRTGAFDLAVALCRLAAAGHPVNLSLWEQEPESAKAEGAAKRGLTVPITGANYRQARPSPRATAPVPAARKPAVSQRLETKLASPVAEPSPEIHPPTPANPSPSAGAPSTARWNSAEASAALQVAQQGMLALQKLQEQTAQLHRQFLEAQDANRRTIEALLSQRRETLGLFAPVVAPPAPSLPAAMLSAPAPVVMPPPPVAPASLPAASPAPSPARPSEAQPKEEEAGIAKTLLDVVSEKTGYPAEMLNLDMGMDSDLGIDSIKRVEIMAALRTRLPHAPEILPEQLGTLQTLREVVAFLAGGRKDAEVCLSPEAPRVAPGQAASVLLRVVSEKTGYPVDMLNLDMGLDSDLGIDSIKRVEIMAALRAQLPSAPEIQPEHLGSLQTLRQIATFLEAAPASAPPAEVTPLVTPAGPGVGDVLLSVVAEKTGYPVEMLNLDMGMDSDLGIDSIKRVEILAAVRTRLPEAPEIQPDQLGTLQTLRQVVQFLDRQPAAPVTEPAPSTSAAEPTAPPLADEPVVQRQTVRPTPLPAVDDRRRIELAPGSLIWMTDDGSPLAAGIEARLSQLGYQTRRGHFAQFAVEASVPAGLLILWPGASDDDGFLREAFRLIRLAAPALRQSGAGAFLVTVSRLDGAFGFGNLNGQGAPVSGGLAGLVKTARHEWPEVNCKAIDLDPRAGAGADVAERVVEEIFRVGPVEVGLSDASRIRLSVEPALLAEETGEATLVPGDLVVITGGARGITAAAALELARACAPRLALLGRTPLEESEPEWLAGLTGEARIKQALLRRAGEPRSPKQLEAAYREAMAQREIRERLAQIRAAGSEVVYRAVDVRDAREVRRALEEIRRQLGPVHGLVHGAGVLADRRIEDKTEEQFDLVYRTKVDGLRNVLAALADDELKVLALFSSYTGRFGRSGQADYAAANEVLNKLAQIESRRRPQCRVVSFNWGPWNGGMVTEGLRKLFEDEGVGLIDLRAGARFFAREVTNRRDGPVEVLALAPSRKSELSDPVESAASVLNQAFEGEVSVAAMPCLVSHVLNDRAVLPTALMIEWLAHGAMHGNPGLRFRGFERFKVLKGLVLDPAKAVQVSVLAGHAQRHDEGLRVSVELVSRTSERQVLHARAEVLLSELPPSEPADITPPATRTSSGTTAAVYGDGRLFHGPHFHGLEAIESSSRTELVARVSAAPSPKQWIQRPFRTGWLADPLALDASFQAMILWTWEFRQAASLPCAIESYRQFASSFPKTGGRVVLRITSADTPVVTADIQYFDRDGRLLALAEGYECVVDAALKEAFQRNRI